MKSISVCLIAQAETRRLLARRIKTSKPPRQRCPPFWCCGLFAFDILVSDGEDLRRLPLSMLKANLSRLLARQVDGIFLSDFEQGEIGPDLFRHACLMGLEGLVSKHRESTYRGGRSDRWIKVKNRQHPAFSRVQDQF